MAGVLIGGASTRMGRPKHLLTFDGVTLVERHFQTLASLGDALAEIVLLGAGAIPDALRDVRRLEDVPGVPGPLAGILAALRAAPDHAWLIAACDLPRLTPAACRWLIEQRDPKRVAVMPRSAGGVIEPLLAVYEPDAAAAFGEALAAGRCGPSGLLNFAPVATPQPPAELQSAWVGVNTPGDWSALDAQGDSSSSPPPM